MKARHRIDDTVLISRAGGASAPPPLPSAELQAMAQTLREYSKAYVAWANDEAAKLEGLHSMRAACAYDIARHLDDAAFATDRAADYFGPYQRAPWEGEHR